MINTLQYKKRIYRLLVARNANIRRDYRFSKARYKSSQLRLALFILKLNLKYRIPFFRSQEPDLTKEGILRKKVQNYVKAYLAYDLISFDVFDTLLLRPLVDPKDVFLLVGNRLNLINFPSIRIKAEKEARKKALNTTGFPEVTVLDIYQYVSLYTGISPEEGAETEFCIELELCYANPYMKTVFDILQSAGKEIIAVSDMYYPQTYIAQLLHNCGYNGLLEIFVSCEHGCSKRSGGLYQIVREKYPNRTILHTGDNHLVDVVNPRLYEIDSLFYRSVNSMGREFRAQGLSRMVGSGYYGVVNAFYNNGMTRGTKAENPYYRYGFVYGGPFILGFVCWIHDYAVKNKMDKVLFLARDGYIMKQVYDRLYTDIPSEYVFWSRAAAIKSTLSASWYEFVRQYIIRRFESHAHWSVQELLLTGELDCILPYLADAKIQPTQPLTEELLDPLVALIHSHKSEIIAQFQDNTEAARAYLLPLIQGCKKVCTVDTGWRGTGPMALKYLIETVFQSECRITGLMAGAFATYPDANGGQLADGALETYLFSPAHNKDHMEFHMKNTLIHSTCIELITSAPHPSLSTIRKEGEHGYQLIFDRPEIGNYEKLEQLHQGVLDFVQEYTHRFQHFPFLYQITGSDAYTILSHIMNEKDYRFLTDQLGNYAYHRYVGGLEHTVEMDTFRDMITSTKKQR